MIKPIKKLPNVSAEHTADLSQVYNRLSEWYALSELPTLPTLPDFVRVPRIYPRWF